jgi:nitroreductase
VAYATSFGNKAEGKFKPDFVSKHQENLRKFDAISVREDYAVETAKTIFGVDATQVVDPVFLVSQYHYNELAGKAAINLEGRFLAVFYLDPDRKKKKIAMEIAAKLGLEKVIVIPNPDKGRARSRKLFSEDIFHILDEDSPENFLHALKQSTYVLTDSFHGTAFAVIFKKPFSSIYNTKRGVDRFVSLMNDLGFGDSRRIYKKHRLARILENPNISLSIDFTDAETHIEKEKSRSLKWLQKAMTAEKPENAGAGRNRGSVRIDCSKFSANNDAWKIETTNKSTKLSIRPGAAVKGNLVWCDLPDRLRNGEAYRLTLKWRVKSDLKRVNVHLRNPKTGKFVVIGSVSPTRKYSMFHSDTIDFVSPGRRYTQLMLGALHFTGDNAGVDISAIFLKPIAADAMVGSKPVPSEEKLSLLAEADKERFLGAYAKGMASRNVGNARALLMFHSHSLEKGLSRSDFRAGFGKVAVPGLAREMKKWLDGEGDTSDPFFQIAVAVLHSYFTRHKSLEVDVDYFWELFTPDIQRLIEKADDSHGGVISAELIRESTEEASERSFIDLVYARRSVREFNSSPVTPEEVERAVSIAIQAPSVCNRQPARVHLFEDRESILKALKLQGGYHGYEPPPKLLLVTSDLTAYVFPDERNQAYIDGGLFMMNLLLGLEHVGIGACSLNTAMSTERATSVRDILGIPESQVFISFIAIGHYDSNVLVPKSKRLSVDDILTQHKR